MATDDFILRVKKDPDLLEELDDEIDEFLDTLEDIALEYDDDEVPDNEKSSDNCDNEVVVIEDDSSDVEFVEGSCDSDKKTSSIDNINSDITSDKISSTENNDKDKTSYKVKKNITKTLQESSSETRKDSDNKNSNGGSCTVNNVQIKPYNLKIPRVDIIDINLTYKNFSGKGENNNLNSNKSTESERCNEWDKQVKTSISGKNNSNESEKYIARKDSEKHSNGGINNSDKSKEDSERKNCIESSISEKDNSVKSNKELQRKSSAETLEKSNIDKSKNIAQKKSSTHSKRESHGKNDSEKIEKVSLQKNKITNLSNEKSKDGDKKSKNKTLTDSSSKIISTSSVENGCKNYNKTCDTAKKIDVKQRKTSSNKTDLDKTITVVKVSKYSDSKIDNLKKKDYITRIDGNTELTVQKNCSYKSSVKKTDEKNKDSSMTETGKQAENRNKQISSAKQTDSKNISDNKIVSNVNNVSTASGKKADKAAKNSNSKESIKTINDDVNKDLNQKKTISGDSNKESDFRESGHKNRSESRSSVSVSSEDRPSDKQNDEKKTVSESDPRKLSREKTCSEKSSVIKGNAIDKTDNIIKFEDVQIKGGKLLNKSEENLRPEIVNSLEVNASNLCMTVKNISCKSLNSVSDRKGYPEGKCIVLANEINDAVDNVVSNEFCLKNNNLKNENITVSRLHSDQLYNTSIEGTSTKNIENSSNYGDKSKFIANNSFENNLFNSCSKTVTCPNEKRLSSTLDNIAVNIDDLRRKKVGIVDPRIKSVPVEEEEEGECSSSDEEFKERYAKYALQTEGKSEGSVLWTRRTTPGFTKLAVSQNSLSVATKPSPAQVSSSSVASSSGSHTYRSIMSFHCKTLEKPQAVVSDQSLQDSQSRSEKQNFILKTDKSAVNSIDQSTEDFKKAIMEEVRKQMKSIQSAGVAQEKPNKLVPSFSDGVDSRRKSEVDGHDCSEDEIDKLPSDSLKLSEFLINEPDLKLTSETSFKFEDDYMRNEYEKCMDINSGIEKSVKIMQEKCDIVDKKIEVLKNRKGSNSVRELKFYMDKKIDYVTKIQHELSKLINNNNYFDQKRKKHLQHLRKEKIKRLKSDYGRNLSDKHIEVQNLYFNDRRKTEVVDRGMSIINQDLGDKKIQSCFKLVEDLRKTVIDEKYLTDKDSLHSSSWEKNETLEGEKNKDNNGLIGQNEDARVKNVIHENHSNAKDDCFGYGKSTKTLTDQKSINENEPLFADEIVMKKKELLDSDLNSELLQNSLHEIMSKSALYTKDGKDKKECVLKESELGVNNKIVAPAFESFSSDWSKELMTPDWRKILNMTGESKIQTNDVNEKSDVNNKVVDMNIGNSDEEDAELFPTLTSIIANEPKETTESLIKELLQPNPPSECKTDLLQTPPAPPAPMISGRDSVDQNYVSFNKILRKRKLFSNAVIDKLKGYREVRNKGEVKLQDKDKQYSPISSGDISPSYIDNNCDEDENNYLKRKRLKSLEKKKRYVTTASERKLMKVLANEDRITYDLFKKVLRHKEKKLEKLMKKEKKIKSKLVFSDSRKAINKSRSPEKCRSPESYRSSERWRSPDRCRSTESLRIPDRRRSREDGRNHETNRNRERSRSRGRLRNDTWDRMRDKLCKRSRTRSRSRSPPYRRKNLLDSKRSPSPVHQRNSLVRKKLKVQHETAVKELCHQIFTDNKKSLFSEKMELFEFSCIPYNIYQHENSSSNNFETPEVIRSLDEFIDQSYRLPIDHCESKFSM